MTWFSTALAGLLTGAGLIVAIGPQNVMVLRTGVARTHVRSVVAVCATSDIVLILGGVAGLGTVVSGHPSLVVVATVLGGGYVIVLGLLAARRAVRAARTGGEAMTVADEGRTTTRAAVVATALLLTFGNPHVYLDTVLTLGAVANAHGPDLRWAFGLGACAASIMWFAALGFGAGRLAPWFARPRAWQVLDGVIAVVMITFGTLLLFSVTSL